MKEQLKVILYLIFVAELFLFLLPNDSLSAKSVNKITVNLEGIDEELQSNVNSYLEIDDLNKRESIDVSLIKTLHRKAPSQIRKALEPLGYYEAQVESKLERAENEWSATYEVNLGKPIRIRQLRLNIEGKGKEFPRFRELIKNFPLAQEDILHQGRYEKAKNRFLSVANKFGFFNARFEKSSVQINRDKRTATVELLFQTGVRHKYGKINFQKNVLSDTFLEKFLIIDSGDPYSSDQINEQEELFSRTKYFVFVNIKVSTKDSTSSTVPVDIIVKPRTQSDLGAGFGFGTNTGPRFRMNYRNRRYNSDGHQIAMDMLLSTVESDITAKYTIPLENPNQNTLQLRSSLARQDFETSESNFLRLGITNLKEHETWLENRSLVFREEDFEVADQSGQSTLIVPSYSLSRTVADDSFIPNYGHRILGKVAGSLENIGSDVDFFQFHSHGKIVRSLSSETRLLVRGAFGATEVDEIRDLPPTFRFFAGGSESVRGYSYQSLGPRNSSGDVLGGKYLVTGSVEIDREIYTNWSLSLFYDAGNSFLELGNTTDELKRGIGFGIRWQSPVGPIRVDLAEAVNKEGSPTRAHFTMGPDL